MLKNSANSDYDQTVTLFRQGVFEPSSLKMLEVQFYEKSLSLVVIALLVLKLHTFKVGVGLESYRGNCQISPALHGGTF